MPENYVDVLRVAEYLGVCRRTVERLCYNQDRSGFPAHKIGKQRRFKLSEVELWVQRQNLPEKGRKPITLYG